MTHSTINRLSAAMLIAGLLGAGAGLAWPSAASADDSTTGAAQRPMSPRESVEQRIADMHATLHITPAEEPKFDQFAQVMLDNAQNMDALIAKNAQIAATRSADDSMRAYADLAQQHAEDMRKLSAAFSTLYAALPADQQKQADAMFQASAAQHAQK